MILMYILHAFVITITYSSSRLIANSTQCNNYRKLDVVATYATGKSRGDETIYECCTRGNETNFQQLFCIDMTFETAWDTIGISDQDVFMTQCTAKLYTDVSWQDPERYTSIECSRICCDYAPNYPVRLTFRSSNQTKLTQTIDFIHKHGLKVHDNYERLHILYQDSKAVLNTLSGIAAFIVGSCCCWFMCLQFSKDAHNEKKRNTKFMKQAYSNQDKIIQETISINAVDGNISPSSKPYHGYNAEIVKYIHTDSPKSANEALRDRQRMQLGRGRYDTYVRLPHETHNAAVRRLVTHGSAFGLGISRHQSHYSDTDSDPYSSESSFDEEFRSSKEQPQQLAIHE